MANHVVLLGDSIFDNGPYVPANETVSDHLSAILSASWRSTLLAKDGAVVSSAEMMFAIIDNSEIEG